jgi:hypothetical protein
MSILRDILGTQKWYNRSMIPNQVGFRFIGKLADNTEVQMYVYKRDTFPHHRVAREDGKEFLWDTLKEWRYH